MAQDASCGNVTISSAADADAIRKTCKTITGNLMFDWYFNETVNLDGIEVIEGDFWHEGDGRACLTAEEMDKFPCLASWAMAAAGNNNNTHKSPCQQRQLSCIMVTGGACFSSRVGISEGSY